MVTSLDRELLHHVAGPAPLGGEVSTPRPVRQPSGRIHGLGSSILAGLGRVWRAYLIAQQARSTSRALSGLGDHALHDIGVDRGAIPAVARQAASAHLAVAGLGWVQADAPAPKNDNPRNRAA